MARRLQQLRQDLLTVRWQPGTDTLVTLSLYLLVVAGLFTAFQIFTTREVAANFITYGPITLAGLGVAVPVFYTALIRRRPLSDVGITTRHLVPSLVLGILLGAYTYQNTLATLNVAWVPAHLPLVTLALTVGLFEAIFFRGFLQLRLEAAFGLIPGLLLGALCYSLYHVGYGMTAEELVTLFILGLFFGAAFRVTRNILLVWPFYTPVGGLYSNINDGLTMPMEAAIGFAITLAMMAAAIGLASRAGKAPRETRIEDSLATHGLANP